MVHLRKSLLIAAGLVTGWALPDAASGDPVVVRASGGTPEEKARANYALKQAGAAARVAEARVQRCLSEMERVSQAIENEQSKKSPVAKAKAKYLAEQAAYKAHRTRVRSVEESETDALFAKTGVEIAGLEYRQLRNELLMSDSRWTTATAALRQAMLDHAAATKAVRDKALDKLVLVGRVAGLYVPVQQDPASSQRAMARLNALTMARVEAYKRGHPAPWRIGVASPRPVRPTTPPPVEPSFSTP